MRRGQLAHRKVFQSTLRMVICPDAKSAQKSIAAVSAQGNTVCVLIRRLNSSCKRLINCGHLRDFSVPASNRITWRMGPSGCEGS